MRMEATVKETVETTGETGQKEPCFHCGEACPKPPVTADGKSFCCAGCRAVYEILAENGLHQYYQLQDRPGISLKGQPEHLARFAYLDDAGLQQRLLDFSDGRLARVTFHLPQIHCASCVWLLENLRRLQTGIPESEIDFLRREIAICYRPPEISLRQVVELLAGLGYEPEITLDSGLREEQARQADLLQDRGLTQKLALAGFCFGNVMLFSLPEYLAGPGELFESWRLFFTMMNILLSLPVLFYSSTEYLISAWRSLRRRTVTVDVPISLGIAALYGRSLYEILAGVGSGYMDSFTGLIFFLLIGKFVQRRTFASLAFDRDYRAYFPLAVTVKEGEEERAIPVSSLAVGQTIRVRSGELVPADSRLRAAACQVDYSYVTGESEPVERRRGELVYAGGRIAGIAVDLEVVKEVSQGYLTRLWNHEAFRKEKEERFETAVDAVSRYFTAAVLGIAALAALFWLTRDPGVAAHVFTSVLIVACPCALALSTPFTAGTALNLLARAGLYLKNPGVVERLAQIDAIVFDKTGTLTSTRQMEVERVGEPLPAVDARRLASALRNSQHPLSRRLLATLPPATGEATGYQEEPGKGLRCAVDGRQIVVGSHPWLIENGVDPAEILPAPAGSAVFAAIDRKASGYFRFRSAYRDNIGGLFAALRERFGLFLLSGDNDREQKRLQPLFGDAGQMRFDQSPTDKLAFVEGLQEENRVMMVGDGLNDAGALRQSEVGIAVAEGSFSPACDGILDADRLDRLPVFLRFARGCRGIVMASFTLSILYNVVGLGFAVQGALSPLFSAILMPLSSVSVIAFATATTHLLARRTGVWR